MSAGPNDNERRPDQPSDAATLESPHDDSEKLELKGPDSATSLRDVSLWAGMFLLLSLIVFSPALRGDFLWDDDKHVSNNLALRTSEGFGKLWVPRTTPQYYPVTHSLFWLQYQIAERDDGTLNTIVFHVTNVLVHAIGATLLWFILRRLQVPGAWLAAAVFTVHPVNVESVAWISELKNVLSGAFFFGSIYVYLRFREVGVDVLPELGKARSASAPGDVEGPRWDLYGLSLGLFVCALLSKSVTCAMPAVALLILWWKWGKTPAKDWLLLLPYFLIGAAMAAFTAHIESTHVIGRHAEMGAWDFGLIERILIAGHAAWFYLSKLLVPVNLMFIYPRWEIDAASLVQWLYPIAALVVLALLWVLRSRIGRAPLAATLMYGGMLVPALGFISFYPMRYSFVADHFQYHASAAMITLIVGGLAFLLRRFIPQAAPATADRSRYTGKHMGEEGAEPSPAPYIIGGVVMVVLIALAWRHARVFDNSISLWLDTIRKNPTAWMAHNNLSTDYFKLADAFELQNSTKESRANYLLAVASADRAIKVKPDHVPAYINRALALERLDKVDAAEQALQQAVKIDPENADALYHLGRMLDQLKRYEEAVAAYDRALALESPEADLLRPQVLRMKGNTLISLERFNEAEAAFLAAIELNREFTDAYFDYGNLLGMQSKLKEAADQYVQVLRLDPRHIDAKINLAYLQMEVGNVAGAQKQLVEAGLIDPYNPRLMEAAKMWDDVVRLAEATTQASTQPSTKSSTTTSATTRSSPATTVPAPDAPATIIQP